ncbi:hypothetical protein CSPX01_07220 [Colletotrichum filicis]|nr:hypothetical protein CSPX01_07220 [Colletotrichum filicis]
MSAIQWESWNDEITQLYVTEDRSAEETIKTLNQRHKLRITIKQFKKRYSGLKKVRANEWRAIKREMRKQKAAGKESLIFLNGRQLEPERIAREMRRYSGIRGQDVEDGGVPIEIGIDTTGQHRLELRTKILSESCILSDTGSSIIRLPSRADITRIAGSCGPNLANTNSSSAETYCLDSDFSNISMSTPCFTELLFQKSPKDTLHVQSIPRPRSGRESADWDIEGTTSAIPQQRYPPSEYFNPRFGLSDSSMALKSRFKISPRFLRMLHGMASNISQVNHFMKALERDISTFASKVDQVRWPSWWQGLDSDLGSGWVTLARGDPSLLLLKPIYFIAENVLRRNKNNPKHHNNADAKDCHMILCQDERLLNLFFSIVLHLICNNIAGIGPIVPFLQWVTEMNVLDRLAMYLKINSGDADALLEATAPLNYHGAGRMSCLQEAARQGNLLLTRFLLERGADVNFAAHEDGGRTALQSAVERGATSVAGCLLSVGADIKAAPAKRNGVTVLEAFAKSNKNGYYPRLAARASSIDPEYQRDQVSKLGDFRNWVAMGAPINRLKGDDSSLLHHLVYNFHYECLESALELGARTETRRRVAEVEHPSDDELEHESLHGAKTPLQLAAYLDEVEAARLLLKYGADINAHPSDEYGRTALQAATCNFREQCGHAMLQLLLSFDTDINAPPAKKGGLTALQGAAISGDLGTVKMLLERGADINAPAAAEDGRTAIEGAAEHGRLDMVEFLLENGAKGDPETGFSRAIELAEAEIHFGVAKVLREHVAISALLEFDITHEAGSDLVGPLPSPGFVFSDEAIADFDFGMPS